MDIKEKLLKNLSVLLADQQKSYERRISEIAHLASLAADYTIELTADAFSLIDALSMISESIETTPSDIPATALPENIRRIKSFSEGISSGDKVLFSDLYLESLGDKDRDASIKDFLPEGGGNGRVSYVRNGFADEAYDVFSQEISGCHVKYCDSFKDAVRDVISDFSEFALLPLEEGGARISTIEEMLYSNELKIAAITPVFGFDGLADMKYALVSKSYRIPKLRPGDESYIELMISNSTGIKLSSMLTAAESLGLQLYRVCSVTFNTADGECSQYSVIMKDGGRGFLAFLVYLTLFEPSAQMIGMYKNLE